MCYPDIFCFIETTDIDQQLIDFISKKNVEFINNTDNNINYVNYFHDKNYCYEICIVYNENTNKTKNVKIVNINTNDYFLCNINSLYAIMDNFYVENLDFDDYKLYAEDFNGIISNLLDKNCN